VENDLRALRLLHDQLIDTAVVSHPALYRYISLKFVLTRQLFPHPRGLPAPRPLREL
jgi:hypothetical protein